MNPEKRLSYIATSKILDVKYKSREIVEDDEMEELIASIRKKGIIEPLIVTPEKDGLHHIIAGHRRFYAGKRVGIVRMPCIIGTDSDKEINEIRFHENAYRTNPKATDEGWMFLRMKDDEKMSIAEIAEVAGKTPSYVSQRLSLMNADPEIFKAVAEGRICFAVSRELQQIVDDRKRKYYTHYAMNDGASVRTVQRWRMEANMESEAEDSVFGLTAKEKEEIGAHPTVPEIQDDEAFILTGIPNANGYFRCVCGLICHASNATATPDGYRCRLCMMDRRKKDLSANIGSNCPACGREFSKHGCIPIHLCMECEEEARKIWSQPASLAE